jgi:leader peptidase (prepilin peptidase)/N-methyltransferase
MIRTAPVNHEGCSVTAPMMTATVLIGVLGLPVGWLLTTVVHRMRTRTGGSERPLALRYLLTALGTGVLFALIAWWSLAGPGRGLTAAAPTLGTVLTMAAILYLAAASIVLALIDIDTHTLPNQVVPPSYLIGGVLLVAAALSQGDYGRLAGAGVGLAVLWSLYFLLAILSPGGMGFGDVKLAGLLGLYLGWLGWGPLVVGAFSAFLLCGCFALALLVTRRVGRSGGIPFGPWMLSGAWLGTLAGASIWDAYLGSMQLTLTPPVG